MSENKTSLYISKIKLKNYRTYIGEQEIELSPDPERPITIIHGQSGHGKTTLLNSIIWALYGKERSESAITDTDEGIINKNLLKALNINDSVESYIDLWIYDDKKPLYHIKRTITATKTSETTKTSYDEYNRSTVPQGISFKTDLKFQHTDKPEEGLKDEDSEVAYQYIQNLFPEVLSSYMFFDAELLHQFLNQKEETLVKEGIEKISDLPIMDNAVKHFSKTTSKIEKTLRGPDAQLNTLIADKNDYEQKRDDLKKQLNKTKMLYESIKSDLDSVEAYLRESPEVQIKEKQQRLDALKDDLKLDNANLDEINQNVKTLLFENMKYLYLKHSMKSAEVKFQKYQDDGVIPPAISKLAIGDLLKSSPPKCICGRSLEPESAERQQLERMYDNIIDAIIIQDITRGRERLSMIMEQISSTTLREQYAKYVESRQKLKERIRKNQASQKQINDFFRTHSIEDIKLKSLQKDELLGKSQVAYSDIREFKHKLNWFNSKLKDLEADLSNALKKDEKFHTQQNQLNFCVWSKNILTKMRNELLDEFKQKTENAATKYFLEIAPRKEEFKCVEISENFQIRAKDVNGNTVKLSMGQAHCLGLSYIGAIREITKQNYFIMIDSPLHNISQEARVDIAKILPKYLKGTQLTLLVTDQEYTGIASKNISGNQLPSVRETLMSNNNVWREYILHVVNDPDGSRTEIKGMDDHNE